MLILFLCCVEVRNPEQTQKLVDCGESIAEELWRASSWVDRARVALGKVDSC